ncbi:MAG: fluoride efflux transporter CrcB [Chloroflexota bacterium]|nr:fluoride efflux transporter CrcB [Chloroflexota bacterium]
MFLVFLVGVGGFLGAVSRYLLGGWVHDVLRSPGWPYGTFAVNIVGCLLIGFFVGIGDGRNAVSAQSRAFILVGFLGGFTTFSAFGYETFALMRQGQMLGALANVSAQVILGLVAVWAGYAIAQAV